MLAESYLLISSFLVIGSKIQFQNYAPLKLLKVIQFVLAVNNDLIPVTKRRWMTEDGGIEARTQRQQVLHQRVPSSLERQNFQALVVIHDSSKLRWTIGFSGKKRSLKSIRTAYCRSVPIARKYYFLKLLALVPRRPNRNPVCPPSIGWARRYEWPWSIFVALKGFANNYYLFQGTPITRTMDLLVI